MRETKDLWDLPDRVPGVDTPALLRVWWLRRKWGDRIRPAVGASVVLCLGITFQAGATCTHYQSAQSRRSSVMLAVPRPLLEILRLQPRRARSASAD